MSRAPHHAAGRLSWLRGEAHRQRRRIAALEMALDEVRAELVRRGDEGGGVRAGDAELIRRIERALTGSGDGRDRPARHGRRGVPGPGGVGGEPLVEASEMKTPTVIEVVECPGDTWVDDLGRERVKYLARDAWDRGRHATGRHPYEAIVNLISAHPDRFGIAVEFPEEPRR